ncbi:hypothetical protein Cni_G02172 [Canna indica]|uniref:Uncharacterized protein n=1 Tax=Canna indica TaxID=4628 RepID=A0AAQ3Q209_9LILI|nr:hypothetical protein Cni_G02172 [Canna indica]
MSHKRGSTISNKDEDMEIRGGPWTLEEDTLLIHSIAFHGQGRWNLLARCSGLKRTGKSCRLRWLNYLKPDIKRGNLSPEEQLLILELHSKWGNRWSRIAQHLPGRTDNEIKNYWRTRVQKQARQLKIDANSAMFRDAVRCYWMPRLLEKMMTSQPPYQSMQIDLHASADAAVINQQLQLPPQVVHWPLQEVLQLENNRSSTSYELSGLTTAAVHTVHQVPNLTEFSSTANQFDELSGLELNPVESGPLTNTSADKSSFSNTTATAAANNCMSMTDDDNVRKVEKDELYAILESYLDGVLSSVEDEMVFS